ncbi:hypothetical protein KFL_000530170 [Klebsormidium nitens]|uniref:Glycosyltransferase family 92 protein n=1 Tax=Klebsormidium nitens TaxID=105231 RepID=A0A1Y1HT67_KLENI|nr:hypothetical protein KFL_000530170 [Klebsormidium nitens]|eukprot:GAQ80389.1 hypothetical protein KFL_000530170 [Klebsormidium nitens]
MTGAAKPFQGLLRRALMPTAVIIVLCILAGLSVYNLTKDNSSRLGGPRSGFPKWVQDFEGSHTRLHSENATLRSPLRELEGWSKVAVMNKSNDGIFSDDLDTTKLGELCEAISRREELKLPGAAAEPLKESTLKRAKSNNFLAQLLLTGPERDSLPRGDTSSPSSLIGIRVWPKLTQDEVRTVGEGSKEWDLMSSFLNFWNAGWKLDEAHFYKTRPEALTEAGGGQPGFALFKHVLNPEDPRPVEFVPRGDPSRILLPKCERNVTVKPGGVGICLKVRNEERALEEWLNYQYSLGVSQVSIYDDGSTDRTAEIAQSYGPFVDYMRWDRPSGVFQADEINMYQDCVKWQTKRGAEWIGAIDVDEYVVFEDPNQTLDAFLARFDDENVDVGAVSFAWRLMHSDAVALPDPAFATLDVRFRCRDLEELVLKTFAKTAAHESIDHPHFQKLKPGFRQYVASGAVVDPPGPFASYSPVPSPAWLNHYRRASLFEWVQKSNKRNARRSDVAGGAGSVWAMNEYDIVHLRHTFEACFPVMTDVSAVLNVLARQGCL